MRIDFISDVACPWCAVGLTALETALDRIGPSIPVDLHFEPFELNPQMPPEGEDAAEHLTRKYGVSPEQLAQTRAHLLQRGAEVGFAFGERPRIWNTFDAHRLLQWAGSTNPGKQRLLKHALLTAYHGRAENPGDRDVLLREAATAGLDVEGAAAVLDSDAFAAEVRERERHWQGLGIHSVPAAVVDGRHLISGGQSAAVFEQELRRIAQNAAPAATNESP